MKLIRHIVQFVVFSNIWISLSAATLTAQTLFLYDIKWRWTALLFVFFATLFSYNFQRLTRHKINIEHYDSERVIWIKRHRLFLLIITITSGIFTIILSFSLSFQEIVFLIIPGIISILYSLGKFGLRNLPSLKILFIALVWSASTVFISIFKTNLESNLWMMTSVFLYIFSLCIPFDIRDIEVDESNKKTLPQIMGIPKSILIAISTFSISQIILFTLSNNYWIIVSFTSGVVLLLLSLKKRKELFYSGIIDGHIMLSALIFIGTCQ